jgi:hypothetical protein
MKLPAKPIWRRGVGGGTPPCPFCGILDPYRTDRGFKCREKACHMKFSITVGSVYKNSKIGLRIRKASIRIAWKVSFDCLKEGIWHLPPS